MTQSTFTSFTSLNLLHSTCDDVYNFITDFEKKLETSQETETKIGNTEPVDEDKKRITERINILDSQKKSMIDDYTNFEKELRAKKSNIFKFRQKIRYKYGEDERFLRPMNQVKHNEFDKHILTPNFNPSPKLLTENDVNTVLEDITFPELESIEELLAYNKMLLAQTIIENENLAIDIATNEIKGEIKEVLINKSILDAESKHFSKTGDVLWKEKNDSKWKKMNCTLKHIDNKSYYMLRAKQKDKNSIIRVAMPWCFTQISSDPKIKQDFCITLVPRMIQKKKKTYYLSFSTAKDMTSWLSILERAASVQPDLSDLPKIGFKLIETEHATSI